MTPMPEYRIRHALPEDIRGLAYRLRRDDLMEIQAAGIGPMKALWRCYRESPLSKVVLVEGVLAAAWGLAGEALGRSARPWLLTAPEIERIPVHFVKEAKAEVAQMAVINPHLFGWVDDRYHKAIRFLRILGFEIGEPQPMGRYAMPFRLYSIDART